MRHLQNRSSGFAKIGFSESGLRSGRTCKGGGSRTDCRGLYLTRPASPPLRDQPIHNQTMTMSLQTISSIVNPAPKPLDRIYDRANLESGRITGGKSVDRTFKEGSYRV